MPIFFISDIHLDESNPYIADVFMQFLKEIAGNTTLYILGDLFEMWIGDDDLSKFNACIIRHLDQATNRKLQIKICHGNRDFLLGKRFFAATGCTHIGDEHVIDLSGQRTLLMHGDTLCLEDHAYLKFRKRSRKKFNQWLFLSRSLKRRQKIAEEYRQKSKAYTSTAPQHIMDVTPEEVHRVMRKHRTHHLIHGHTHRPDLHTFELDQQPAYRRVLAPWHEHGSVLVCEDNGQQEVVTLR